MEIHIVHSKDGIEKYDKKYFEKMQGKLENTLINIYNNDKLLPNVGDTISAWEDLTEDGDSCFYIIVIKYMFFADKRTCIRYEVDDC